MCCGSGLLLSCSSLILQVKVSNKCYKLSSQDVKYPDIKGGDAGKFKVEILAVIQ